MWKFAAVFEETRAKSFSWLTKKNVPPDPSFMYILGRFRLPYFLSLLSTDG